MIALEEVVLIEPEEITEVEESARQAPPGSSGPVLDGISENLEKFRGAIYRSLVGQFSLLSASYLRLQVLILDVRASGLTLQQALNARPPVVDIVRKFRGMTHQLGGAAHSFEGASRSVIEEMAALAGRMLANAEALLVYCDSILETGNREFRRSLRKKRPPASHLPKVPITNPGPKPKR